MAGDEPPPSAAWSARPPAPVRERLDAAGRARPAAERAQQGAPVADPEQEEAPD